MASGFESNGAEQDSLVGKRLGKYQVLSRLGEGGMGVVYEAEDVYLKRRVALKVLAPAIMQDKAARKRFLREARAAASLSSPFVVSIFEVDQHNNLIFLVMELFPGTSTQDQLSATGPFDWRAATLITAAACRGLAAVHERGLVHRDIKPANIMLSARGVKELAAPDATRDSVGESVKLADFGLAKCLSGEQSPMTSANTVMGTPVYMSPEQCRAEPLDPRSDVYALGATYFALLTGRPPFLAEQPIQVMFAHCSSPVPDPREFVPQASPGCQNIIARAMAKEPSDRYQSVMELMHALLELVGESRGTTQDPAPPPIAEPREVLPTVRLGLARQNELSASRSNRRVTILAAIVIVMLVLFAGLGYGGYRVATRKSETGIGVTPSTESNLKGSPSDAAFVPKPRVIQASGAVQSLALSDNGELLARGLMGNPGRAYIFDLRTGQDLLNSFSGDGGDSYVRSLTFLPGQEELIASSSHKIWLYQPRSGESWSLIALDNAGVSDLEVSPDGKVLVVGEHNWGNKDSRVLRYDLRPEKGRLAAVNPRTLVTHFVQVKSIAISPDGSLVASIGKDSQLKLGPLAGGEFVSRTLPRADGTDTDYSHSVAFSSDGERLAAVADRRVIVWNLPGLSERKQFDVVAHSTNITLAFVPGTHRLAVGSGVGVSFWNTETGSQEGRLVPSTSGDSISSLVFVPQSDMLITGGLDKRVSIYDWKEAAELTGK